MQDIKISLIFLGKEIPHIQLLILEYKMYTNPLNLVYLLVLSFILFLTLIYKSTSFFYSLSFFFIYVDITSKNKENFQGSARKP